MAGPFAQHAMVLVLQAQGHARGVEILQQVHRVLAGDVDEVLEVDDGDLPLGFQVGAEASLDVRQHVRGVVQVVLHPHELGVVGAQLDQLHAGLLVQAQAVEQGPAAGGSYI